MTRDPETAPESLVPFVCRYVSLVVLRPGSAGVPHEVLLLERSDDTLHGEWCQIAGGIEPGERAWETALRELHEETRLVPERFYSADILEQFYEPDKNRIAVVPVFVAYVGADAEPILNEEHSDWVFVSIERARELVPFPGQRHMLAQIRETFLERTPSEHLRIALPLEHRSRTTRTQSS